jgi:hypothetical protein
MEEIDDDVTDAREISIEAGRARFLAEGVLQDRAQKIRHVAKIGRVHANGVEGSAGDVELITQPHIDIGNFCLGSIMPRPLGQRLQQLLGGDE